MRALLDIRRGFLAVCMLMALVAIEPSVAIAQVTDLTCTDFARLRASVDPATPNTTPGIITNINTFIRDVVGTASQTLFEAFTASGSYQVAVNAAAILMVTFYGVAFTIGVVQANFGQVLQRLIKLGIIYSLISPTGWTFFSDTVVNFFNGGTDQIIGEVISIGTGIPFTPGDSPFLVLDGLASYVLSPDFIVAIMGSLGQGGPYGLAMGAMLGFGFIGFVKLLIEGLKLYAIAFIVRALLFGLAPVFFVFLLFDKTRAMFSGWLSALVAVSLQPILYFTFISFFLVMIMGATQDLFGEVELCWAQYEIKSGSANPQAFWRYKNNAEQFPAAEQFSWQGPISCLITGNACEEFPINIIDLLSFLILVYVATQFAGVITSIAHEIANTTINLSDDAKREAKAEHAKGGANTNKGGAK